MYFRELQSHLLNLSRNWSVISITGPRQSGKTTLSRMTFPDYKYVNLEHPIALQEIKSSPEEFLRLYGNGLIIDEAQRFPDIFSYVQVLVDEDKTRRYVLSGSSDFLMMQNISQSLAGRVSVQRLLPLSISELGDISSYTTNDLIFRGFYPGVWGDGKKPDEVYESYYETYVQRDVRQIINIKDIDAFRHFTTLCASRIGSEFNASALSGEVGVSSVTIKQWVSILETSYTVFLLHPFYRNIGKRLSKTPKIYFYDPGLACYLLGISSSELLAKHPLRGNLFENMVVVEMLKSRYNKGIRSNISFYRDKGQHEVDVIQEYGNKIRAYEIKSATSINADFYRNLKYLKILLGDDLLSTQVIYDGEREWPKTEDGYLNFRHWKEDYML